MPAFAAQYQFAAAFIVFLVALAGVALVLLRGEPLTTRASARLALGAGFLGIATEAFLRGSLLVDAPGVLLGVRTLGLASLIAGSLGWRGSALSRSLLWSGSAALAFAIPFEAKDESSLVATTVSAAGGLLVGSALLSASRRSIAARVAASAAGTLLLLVLVLSIALSTVLATTVEDQALVELDARATSEALAIESQNQELVKDASVVASLLVQLRQSPDDPTSAQLLSQLDPTGTPTAEQRAAISAELERARRDIFIDVDFAYVSEAQRVIAGTGTNPDTLTTVSGSEVVASALRQESQQGGAATTVIGDMAFAVGVLPIGLRSGGGNPFGAVVAFRSLDDAYLERRIERGSAGDALMLFSGTTALASGGALQGTDAIQEVAAEVLAGAARRDLVTDDRVAAARPVRVAGQDQPVLAVVALRSADGIAGVREDLFQTFFVIAFGGAVLALLLAALVGDRIGSGIRRLTASAEAIQLGALGVRSGVRSEDEVGVLGATFDSMAASIEEQTDALSAAAARVEAIVAGMGEALVAIDAAARITDFNAAAVDLLDLPAGDARGRAVEDVLQLVKDDGSDLVARLRATESTRWSALGDLLLPEGEAVPVAVTAGALLGAGGEVEGAVIVLRDLRGEREIERMKRHFLSRVGHELRTPLTPLIGYAQLLAGRDIPADRAKQVYGSILSSAKRLERIVEMLEFFASLDAGRQVIHAESVDVRDVLGPVTDKWSKTVDEKHELTRRIARGTPNVMADARWLGRSVDELIDNAVKFSPGGGRVVVTAGPVEGSPSMVEIAVRDQGVGMTPEEVEHAFAEWSQGDESDTRHFGGLGLGLALVQRVAEHLGGRVSCTTTAGKGATFSIEIPAAVSAIPDEPLRRPRRVRRLAGHPPEA